MDRNAERFAYEDSKRQFTKAGIATLFLLFFSMTIGAQRAASQTLASEYERALNQRCAAMGFARDSGGLLLPGQATGTIPSYCNVPWSASDPPVKIHNTGWADPFYLSGPRVIDRATAMPGWRDRTIRHSQTRAAKRRGEPIEESSSRWNAYLGIRGSVQNVSSSTENGEFDDVNSVNPAFVLGGGYWLSDSLLLSLSGAYRERGYGAGLSLAWAPTERLFGEVLLTHDSSQQNFDRAGSSGLLTGYSVSYEERPVSGSPTMEFTGIDIYGGYDWQAGRWLIGPRIGVAYRSGRQSSYSESPAYQSSSFDGAAPLDEVLPTALTFDSATQQSLSHRLGVNVAYEFKKMLPIEIELAWVHEHQDTTRTVTARFAEDLRANATQLTFSAGERSRDVLAGRLAFGFRIASRYSILATGEARYDQSYGFEGNSTIAFRGKF